MRGVDQEGQVANYVETEQIIEYLGDKASFIQVNFKIIFYKINKQLINFIFKLDERFYPDLLVPVA